MTRLYLIRHGETVFNAKRRIQGSKDIPLSKEGKEQAELLAKRFVGLRVDCIYSSALERAHTTAMEIAGVLRLPVVVDSNLNEMHFGIFEGMTFEEIAKRHPDMWDQREKNKMRYTGHEGESLMGFGKRVMKSIHDIVQLYPKGDIIVVSHGGTNRAIMCALLGLNMKKFHLIRQDNTCINILDLKVRGTQEYETCLWRINDTYHLIDGTFPPKKNVWS